MEVRTKINKMRNILVISGTRSEYGLLKPVITALKKTRDFNIQVVATGAHLEKKFGGTIQEIRRDFKVDAVLKLQLDKDTNESMSFLIGDSISGFTKIFRRLRPDLILVLGDRVEVFGASIAAYYMNIPVAHLHGGDRSIGGHVDDSARHAITKLANIHLAATRESARRIIKMGEEKWRVYTVGAPGLDSILKKRLLSPMEIARKYRLDLKKPILLVIQHSVTSEVDDAMWQMKETMEAIKEIGFQAIVIYPNSDAGGRRMIKVIERYRKYSFIHIYESLPHEEYLSLLRIVSAMIGNSSSGIIESTLFHLPVVNVGPRQKGRERSENIIDVKYDKREIKNAVTKALNDVNFRRKLKKCTSPYGNGKASENVARILKRIKIDKKLIQKKMVY